MSSDNTQSLQRLQASCSRDVRTLSVYDGQRRLGTVLADDANWRTAVCYSFDNSEKLIGRFTNRRDAARALS